MPQGFGRNSFVGWDQETTWGTPVAAAKFAELVSEGIETVRDRVARPVVRDLDEREANLYDALFGARGPFAIELNYAGLLRLFEHLFGDSSVSTVVTEASVRWTHTITLKDTLMSGKGLSLHVNRDVDAGSTPQLRVAGYKLNRATFSFAPDRNGQVEFEGAGKDAALIASVSPTFPSTASYVAGHQLIVEIDDVARPVDSIELTLDNGMDLEKRIVGSKNIDQPVRSDTRRSISGTLTMDALQADWSKLDAGTLFKLELLHTGPTLGAGTFRMDFTALKCLVTGNPFTISGPGIVKSVLPFKALKPTAGELLSLVIVNNESAVG
jgi:tail tube protein